MTAQGSSSSFLGDASSDLGSDGSTHNKPLGLIKPKLTACGLSLLAQDCSVDFRSARSSSHHAGVLCWSQVFIICREALSDAPSCKPALDTLVQYYRSLAAAVLAQGDSSAAAQAAQHGLAVAAKASVADPMRVNYYRSVCQELQQLCGQ